MAAETLTIDYDSEGNLISAHGVIALDVLVFEDLEGRKKSNFFGWLFS